MEGMTNLVTILNCDVRAWILLLKVSIDHDEYPQIMLISTVIISNWIKAATKCTTLSINGAFEDNKIINV